MLKLDAVNYLLGILGSSPVGDLANKNPDVTTAVKALNAAIVSVTSTGFWFNEVYNVTLTPDPITKQIDLSGYTKVITRNTYAVARNDLLFDPKNNTYQFESPVVADAVAILDFELNPESVQDAILYWAGVQLCTVELEDATKRAEIKEFYNNALLQMRLEEREVKRTNRLSSPRIARALYRVRPARLNGSGGPNFGGR